MVILLKTTLGLVKLYELYEQKQKQSKDKTTKL